MRIECYPADYCPCAPWRLQIWIMINAIKMGLPAVPNKGLANLGFTSIGTVGSAMSIFGFVFFIQPIMMAMLQEMPVRYREIILLSVS